MTESFKYTVIIIIFQLMIKNFNSYKLSNSQIERDYYSDDGVPHEDVNWEEPHILKTLGQITGVSMNSTDYLYVLHRGNRMRMLIDQTLWDKNNITVYNSTIKGDTIVLIDILKGMKIKSWGNDIFNFPHEITVDHHNSVWVTDIGSHQVMRYERNACHPNLILGENLIPGNDSHHFCAPTRVKVSSSDIVYISDGYCNSRIIRFSYSGEYMGEIAIPGIGMVNVKNINQYLPLDGNIIHGVELIEDYDMVCASNNGDTSIYCYYAGLRNAKRFGEFRFSMKMPAIIEHFDYIGNGTIMALSLWVENSPIFGRVISIHLPTKTVVNSFGPDDSDGKFDFPHTMTVSSDRSSLYVAEIFTNITKRMHKFNL